MNYLPLYHFFCLLKEHKDFQLGLEEYLCLIEVLQKDTSYFQAEKLLTLCQLLWLKPNQNKNLFIRLFELAVQEDIVYDSDDKIKKNEQKKKDDFDDHVTLIDDEVEPKNANDDYEEVESFVEEDRLFLTITSSTKGQSKKVNSEESLVAPYKVYISNKYYFLSTHQLGQEWRFLKKEKIADHSSELNIKQTIKYAVKKGGAIWKLFYHPQKQNNAKLVALVDNKGSMMPFQNLVNEILFAAHKMAEIDVSTFYFYNVPSKEKKENPADPTDYILYTSKAHSRYKLLQTELKKILNKNPDTAILLFSDAGAARGALQTNRIYDSAEFIQTLKQFTPKIACLNPIPEDRWIGTTASFVRDFVPMFEATEIGLKNAIKVLRGKTSLIKDHE